MVSKEWAVELAGPQLLHWVRLYGRYNCRPASSNMGSVSKNAVDTRLPFGLKSAPKIFSAVADALQWSFLRRGVSWVAYYFDDFHYGGLSRES